jgi:hypothetical protein
MPETTYLPSEYPPFETADLLIHWKEGPESEVETKGDTLEEKYAIALIKEILQTSALNPNQAKQIILAKHPDIEIDEELLTKVLTDVLNRATYKYDEIYFACLNCKHFKGEILRACEKNPENQRELTPYQTLIGCDQIDLDLDPNSIEWRDHFKKIPYFPEASHFRKKTLEVLALWDKKSEEAPEYGKESDSLKHEIIFVTEDAKERKLQKKALQLIQETQTETNQRDLYLCKSILRQEVEKLIVKKLESTSPELKALFTGEPAFAEARLDLWNKILADLNLQEAIDQWWNDALIKMTVTRSPELETLMQEWAKQMTIRIVCMNFAIAPTEEDVS